MIPHIFISYDVFFCAGQILNTICPQITNMLLLYLKYNELPLSVTYLPHKP